MLRSSAEADDGSVCFLGTAFQCQAPKTWKYIDGKCDDQVRGKAAYNTSARLTLLWQFAFWTSMESVNILTDVGLMGALISIVWVLTVPLSKKLVLVFAFGTRIL